CLIVDGYNMIFAWPDLAQLAEQSLEHARSELISRLHNYQGFRRCLIIVVFDAYRREQNKEQIYKEHHLYIVFTKASQTADSYIEKTTHTLANQYQIQVATSDAQEQNIILGAGAMRMSAQELLKEMEHFHHQTLNSLVYQPRFQHMALSDLRKWNEVHDEDDE
ncbi:MAG: NYN domain-containing protein, partial [Erysipelotrichaceae bacterium]|nr:NYN domain-containing protein [Erysipelotrichaceae bacterium]